MPFSVTINKTTTALSVHPLDAASRFDGVGVYIQFTIIVGGCVWLYTKKRYARLLFKFIPPYQLFNSKSDVYKNSNSYLRSHFALLY